MVCRHAGVIGGKHRGTTQSALETQCKASLTCVSFGVVLLQESGYTQQQQQQQQQNTHTTFSFPPPPPYHADEFFELHSRKSFSDIPFQFMLEECLDAVKEQYRRMWCGWWYG